MKKCLIFFLISIYVTAFSLLLSTGKSFADSGVNYKTNSVVPNIMEVPPAGIYQAWQNQYLLKPDKRYLKTLDILIELVAHYNGNTEKEYDYRFISKIINKNKFNVSLLKNDKQVKKITLQIPVLFSEQMRSMSQFLEAMGVHNNVKTARPQRNSVWEGELDAALADFNMIDARFIIEGMNKIEKLGRSGPFDSRLLLAAARGYSLLITGLSADLMQHNDRFNSKALAFLAFAKQIDSQLASDHTEALVANSLGYTAYACRLLDSSDEPADKAGNLFAAYIRNDAKTLKRIKGDGSKLLGYYLLTRLYRKAGLKEAARSEIRALYKRIPDNFPVMVENIFSDDFNSVKRYTALYQRQVYVAAVKHSGLNAYTDEALLSELITIIKGEESSRTISFEHFDKLLAKGKKVGNRDSNKLFINSDDIDCIYRSLYSGAVNLRFNLLYNRWNVIRKAERYAASFQKKNVYHPQVIFMKASVLDETGHKKEAESLFLKIIKHPDSSPQLILKAHKCLDVYSLKQNRVLPAIVSRLDSRPSLLSKIGRLFFTHLNYDYAEKYYRMSIELNPYTFYNYKTLSGITGNDKAVQSALKKYSDHVQMLKAAGDYYAVQHGAGAMEQARQYYKKAVDMEPSSSTNIIRLSAVLKRLKRYNEAAKVLKNWIESHGNSDNATTVAWSGIADCYLKEGKPLSAMAILIDSEDFYRLIRVEILADKRPDALMNIHDSIDSLNAAINALGKKNTERAVKGLSDHMYRTTASLLNFFLEQRKKEAENRNVTPTINATILTSLYKAANSIFVRRLEQYGQITNDDLTTLIISCIDSGDNDLAVDIMKRTILRYEKAISLIEDKQDEKALGYISVNTDDYQKSIIVRTAGVYEMLNQLSLSEKTIEKGLQRYFTLSSMYSDAASFMWRNGRYEEAAKLIADGSKNQDRFSGWFIDDFMTVFSEKTDPEIFKAVDTLKEKGIDRWYMSSLSHRFLRLNRPETAFKIIDALQANKMMMRMEKFSDLYNIRKEWKGESAAVEYLIRHVTGDARSMLSAALFADGHYKPVLSLLEHPDSFSRYREFVWLQRLMAWLAVDKKPESLNAVFDTHYEITSSDYYYAIGRYLSGKITKHQLLTMIRTPKQRCEIAYYIGFKERMNGNYPAAADWYQVCRETLLENNGEYHWAFNELFWWGHMGTTGRHRLMSDDKKEYFLRKKI